MTRKTINVIIGIVLAFIVVFCGSWFACEQYNMDKDDERYEESLKDLDDTAKDNQSGATNEESKNNN